MIQVFDWIKQKYQQHKQLIVYNTLIVWETLINYGECKSFYKHTSVILATITIVSVTNKALATK